MSINLLDMLKEQVAGDLGTQAAKFLGESESNVGSALSSILPSILGSTIDKGSSEAGAGGLMDMMKDFDTSILGNIGSLFGGGAGAINGLLNSGSGILSFLMGDKIGGVVDIIMKASGMKSSAASSLIKMAAPFVIGMISKHVRSNGLNVGGLMDLLSSQKESVGAALPEGLGSSLGLSSFGLGSIVDSASDLVSGAAGKATALAGNATDAISGAADNVGDAGKRVLSGATGLAGDALDGGKNIAANVGGAAVKTGGGLLKWILPALLGLLALGYFGSRGCNTGVGALDDLAAKTMDATENVAGAAADMAGDAVDVAGDVAGSAAGALGGLLGNINEAAKAALDKVTFTTGSVGSQIMDFIEGGVASDKSFRFNNLNFATGSADISGSTVEVDNLAKILAAYPDMKINVNGYTDNTGNAMSNVKLSESRAISVKNRLVAQGVAAMRIATQGLGDANPVGDNGTAEGRAENRRIEVTFNK